MVSAGSVKNSISFLKPLSEAPATASVCARPVAGLRSLSTGLIAGNMNPSAAIGSEFPANPPGSFRREILQSP